MAMTPADECRAFQHFLGMDGDAHRKVRSLLQPAFMPENVNKWRPKIDRVAREDFLQPLVPNKKADLMEMGLNFPVRAMYALVGFPEDDPDQYNQYAVWALSMLAANQLDKAKATLDSEQGQKSLRAYRVYLAGCAMGFEHGSRSHDQFQNCA